MIPRSLATDSSVKYGWVTKRISSVSASSTRSVAENRYTVRVAAVYAFASAPSAENFSKESLPSSLENSLCSKKCATPAGYFSPSAPVLSTEPKSVASRA